MRVLGHLLGLFGPRGGMFRQGTKQIRKGPKQSRQGTKRTHMDPVTICQLTRRHYSEKSSVLSFSVYFAAVTTPDLISPMVYPTPRSIPPPILSIPRVHTLHNNILGVSTLRPSCESICRSRWLPGLLFRPGPKRTHMGPARPA